MAWVYDYWAAQEITVYLYSLLIFGRVNFDKYDIYGSNVPQKAQMPKPVIEMSLQPSPRPQFPMEDEGV